MRRLLTSVLIALVAVLGMLAGPSAAQDDVDPADAGQVTVVELTGLLDDVVVEFISDSIDAAPGNGDLALVLRVNSTGAVIPDEEVAALAAKIAASPVPIVVWVGPSGANAKGEVAQLISVAAAVNIAPGSNIGDTGERFIEPTLWNTENADRMLNASLNWEQVIDVGVVPCERIDVDELGRTLTPDEQLLRCAAPTVGDFLVDLDEFGFQTRQIVDTDEIRLEPLTQVRFQGLDLLSNLMHTIASPPVAYLLLIIGLALFMFEHFSVGVGIAGSIGAVLTAMSGYGFSALPFRWWALAAILLAFVVWLVDVQSGVSGPLTIVATVVFAVGTVGLWDGVSMSWIPMTVGVTGLFVLMWLGMPLTIRGRFGTPRIDRDDFIGEEGVVVADNLVRVRDTEWKASGVDGADLAPGERVRVTAVDDLIFAVEPAPRSD